MLRPYGPLLSEWPPILKFNRKPFSKAGSYSQQSNRLKIVFLTVGPLLIQSVESNGFHLDPQSRHAIWIKSDESFTDAPENPGLNQTQENKNMS